MVEWGDTEIDERGDTEMDGRDNAEMDERGDTEMDERRGSQTNWKGGWGKQVMEKGEEDTETESEMERGYWNWKGIGKRILKLKVNWKEDTGFERYTYGQKKWKFLGSSRLENCTFCVVATWEIVSWEVAFGKIPNIKICIEARVW